MYQLTKRQESILYYVLTGKENINTKKLASRYKLSERSIHYDLEYINAWLGERGAVLKKNKTNGLFFEGDEEVRSKIQDEMFIQNASTKVFEKTDRLVYICNRLLLAEGMTTSDDLLGELGVSKPTVLAAMKEAEAKFAEMHLRLVSKKGAGYHVEGKEIVMRTAIESVLGKILMCHGITNYDILYEALQKEESNAVDYRMALEYIRELDVFPIYDCLNIMRREQGIFVSDADSFVLFLSLVVMVKRLLRNHTVKKENIMRVERNELTNRHLLARAICEQLEDDYDVHCSKYEIIHVLLRMVSCNVGFAEGKSVSLEEELGATIELMLQILKDYEVVFIEDQHMQDLKDDLYEYLDMLMHKRKLKIGAPNPLLVQTKAGYPHIFMEAVRMAEIFKMREGVELTEEEIGTITIYVASYAKNQEVTQPKKALLVSDEGKGLSRLLYNRVKNNIPHIDIQDVVSVNEFTHRPEIQDGIDMVISTTELTGAEVPVFCVNPIISVFDIRYITDYITGRTSLKVLDDLRRQENFLERAVMAVLGMHMDLNQLELVRQELEYILAAGTGLVTEENTQLIQEEYAYKVSMVLVKLAEMFVRIKKDTDALVDIDSAMGLVIHILMSVTRWENKEFLQEKNCEPESNREVLIRTHAETFLKEISELFHNEIHKEEAVAISRYF